MLLSWAEWMERAQLYRAVINFIINFIELSWQRIAVAAQIDLYNV